MTFSFGLPLLIRGNLFFLSLFTSMDLIIHIQIHRYIIILSPLEAADTREEFYKEMTDLDIDDCTILTCKPLFYAFYLSDKAINRGMEKLGQMPLE